MMLLLGDTSQDDIVEHVSNVDGDDSEADAPEATRFVLPKGTLPLDADDDVFGTDEEHEGQTAHDGANSELGEVEEAFWFARDDDYARNESIVFDAQSELCISMYFDCCYDILSCFFAQPNLRKAIKTWFIRLLLSSLSISNCASYQKRLLPHAVSQRHP